MPSNIKELIMLNSSKELLSPNTASRCQKHQDFSSVFKEILLDASVKNEFGFKERDILPLFLKYQNKRQFISNILSFFTYVFQLPTLFYLQQFRKDKYSLCSSSSRFDWFTTNSKRKP